MKLSLDVIFTLVTIAACSSGNVQAQKITLLEESAVAPAIERRWEKIYGNALFHLIEEKPLAWLPMGVIERHGEHLPWGLDADKAHLICLRLADKFGGVVLPVNHLAGIHGDRRPHQSEEDYRLANRQAADMMYTEGYFRRFLNETFDGLANLGFQVIVAYSGHWPSIQGEILQQEAARFNAGGRATVIPFGEIMACGVVDHGAKYEGSIWAALVPGSVRLDSIVDYNSGKMGWYRGREIRSQISAEFGEEVLAMIEAYLKSEIDKTFDRKQK
jgi:creatinine amidohydrolase